MAARDELPTRSRWLGAGPGPALQQPPGESPADGQVQTPARPPSVPGILPFSGPQEIINIAQYCNGCPSAVSGAGAEQAAIFAALLLGCKSDFGNTTQRMGQEHIHSHFGNTTQPCGVPMSVSPPPPKLTCRPPSLLEGCCKATRRRMLTPFPKSPHFSPKAAVSPHGPAEREAQRQPPLSWPPPARRPFPPHRAGAAAAAGAGAVGFHIPLTAGMTKTRGWQGVRGDPCAPEGPPHPTPAPARAPPPLELCTPQAEGPEARARRRKARLPFFFRKR